MNTIFDTAGYILERCGAMPPARLQRLCYYAQVWNLVWNHAPLFDEDFYAWKSGPVCSELFLAVHGKFVVDTKDLVCAGHLSDEEKEAVDNVLEYYGPRDVWWLSQLICMEDPWKKAMAEAGNKAGIITKESMERYYSKLCMEAHSGKEPDEKEDGYEKE